MEKTDKKPPERNTRVRAVTYDWWLMIIDVRTSFANELGERVEPSVPKNGKRSRKTEYYHAVGTPFT